MYCWVLGSIESRRGCWDPWSWSYKQLWAMGPGYWEPESSPSQEQHLLLTMQPSRQIHFILRQDLLLELELGMSARLAGWSESALDPPGLLPALCAGVKGSRKCVMAHLLAPPFDFTPTCFWNGGKEKGWHKREKSAPLVLERHLLNRANVAEETEGLRVFPHLGASKASALISVSLCYLKSLSQTQKLAVLQGVIDESVTRACDLSSFIVIDRSNS